MDDDFKLEISATIDFALAISPFTHINMNLIIHCLASLHAQLVPAGVCYAMFFESPSPVYFASIKHHREAITHFDHDPYHHSRGALEWMGSQSGYRFDYVGELGILAASIRVNSSACLE